MTCSKCSNIAKSKGLCSKHYQQEWRKQNLMQYTFSNLKSNAKRRGKYFDLTFEEFSEFAIETNYLGKKGKTSMSMSIDRIKNELGYTKSNIQPLSLGANSRKFTKILNANFNYETNQMEATVVHAWYEQMMNGVTAEEACPF